MMSFNSVNDEANYYSELSGKTGENQWNQDKFQISIIKMVEPCNLSKEQIEKLGRSMVENNAELDMKPSNNKSVIEFRTFSKNKADTLEQGKGMNIAA